MVTKEDAKKIYDSLIDNGKILISNLLLSQNYSKAELKDFGINNNSPAFYVLSREDGLFAYGLELEKEGNYYKAVLAYQICYKINHNNMHVNYRLFLYSVHVNNHSYVNIYLKQLLKSKNPYTKKMTNFLFYLFSYYYKFLETAILEYLLSLNLQDMLDDRNTKSAERINKVIRLVFEQKLEEALELLENVDTQSPFSLNMAIKIMLIQARESRKRTEERIDELISYGKIAELKRALRRERIHRLDDEHVIIEVLCDDIIEMNTSRRAIKITTPESGTLLSLVLSHNYGAAIFENSRLLEAGLGGSTRLDVLLRRAISVMEKYGARDTKNSLCISSIIELFKGGDILGAERRLLDYSYANGKDEYCYFVHARIQLLLLGEKEDYTEIVNIVVNRENLESTVSWKIYMRLCDDAIMIGEKEKALIYLELLEHMAANRHFNCPKEKVQELKDRFTTREMDGATVEIKLKPIN